jgi:uncharacterized protein (TIGR02145 family)
VEVSYDPTVPVGFVTTTGSGDAEGNAEGDDTGAVTRGTPITAASQMTTMGVFASYTSTSDWTASASLGKMFNQKLTYTAGEWEYPAGEEVYWGATTLADRYSFFAYAPYGSGVYNATSNATGNGLVVDTATTTGTPTLTYTVPVKVQNQPDLMVAVPKKNVRPSGAKVSLAMEHALTSVAFQIKGNGEKVKSISVQGVSVSGTLAVDGGTITWSNLAAPTTTDFSASLNFDTDDDGDGEEDCYTTTETMSTNLIAGDGYLMMIPQTLTAGAKVVVTYSDDTTKELALSADTWEAGKKVVYNITLTLEGGDANILYFGTDNRLSVGRWDNSTVTVSNMVYTQFGSVIGFTGSVYAWNASHVKFNPTATASYDYTSIPNYGKPTTAWAGSIAASPSVSSSAYHNDANLLLGRGDICKLVGLTSAQAKAMADAGTLDEYQSGWRLPTREENRMFVGLGGNNTNTPSNGSIYYTYTTNGNTIANPNTGTFPKNKYYQAGVNDVTLPATGYRTPSGSPTGQLGGYGTNGYYWSSTANNSSNGYSLYFYSSRVNPSSNDSYAYGFSVRCVSTGEEPTPLTPVGGVLAPPGVIGYIAGTNTLTLRGSKEYSADADIAAYAETIDPRGLEEKTVYMAYFKFGSLVALSSDPSDASSPYLEPDDIIAAPSTPYIGLDALKANVTAQTTDADRWSQVPVSTSLSTGATIGTDLTSGLGDPCDYYFGDGDGNASGAGSTWRLPSNPYNGTPNYDKENMDWEVAGVLGTGLPGGWLSTRAGEAGWFYPLAGHRFFTGGYVDNQGDFGYYWSSTAYTGSSGRFLYLSEGTSVLPSNFSDYNYGFGVRCVKTPITVSPSTATFAAAGGTKTLTVTTSNISGALSVTAIDDATGTAASWITSATVSGSTLTVTTAANPSTTTARSATVTLTAGTSLTTTTVPVTQERIVEGVLAPPGVIGYIRGTHTLTLRGSKEYAVDADIAAYAETIHAEGLEDETVYIAFFKFGSLVAISSDPTDTSSPSFESEDVIAAPSTADGYIGLEALKANVTAQTTDGNRWSQVPVSPSLSANATIGTNLTSGLGDPCDYYFGDGDGNASGAGSTWRLPSGNPYNGTPNYSATNLTLKLAGDLGAGLPGGQLSTRAGETGWFYPLVGQRYYSGGEIHPSGQDGSYWSSTAQSGSKGYNLGVLSDGTVFPSYSYNYPYGFGVRCVKPSIAVSPTTASFAAAGETKTFTVTTNIAGTPTVTAVDDATGTAASWITTASVSGSTLTVTATANPSTTAARSATLTLTSGTTTTTVTITQPKTVGGMLAPPGVIGYIKGTNTLTLRGSKEYAVNSAIAAYAERIHAEGLEDETVYIAYFKFGSLIALSSDPTDTDSPYIESEDIIKGPTEYTGWDALKASPTWDGIPAYTGGPSGDYYFQDGGGNYTKRDISHADYQTPASGKGDPCMYYFGTDGWKLPTGNPYNGVSYSESNLTWKPAGATGMGAGLPAGRLNTRASGWFFPAAGHRDRSLGYVSYQDSYGFYWSSTTLSSFEMYHLNFNSTTNVSPSERAYLDYGLSVRCVRP